MIRTTLFAALAAAGLMCAQSTTSDEVRKAETAWVNAAKTNDLKAAGALLADDLVYTHSSGLVETKAQYVAKLKSGEQKYTGIEYSDMNVRTYGNTSVVTAKVRMTGATKGVPFDNQLRIIHVWVKQGNRWQLVAHQTTKLP